MEEGADCGGGRGEAERLIWTLERGVGWVGLARLARALGESAAAEQCKDGVNCNGPKEKFGPIFHGHRPPLILFGP